MQGLILVNKPIGISSFRVVSRVRGIIKAEIGQKIKVGHSGTLDPMATGLLIIAIGAHTKKLPELIGQDKTYDVEMCLGKTSTTGDIEGELINICDKELPKTEILSALNKFTGKILQTPPIYSAIKVNGQRAYKLARAGKEVIMPPRQVEIYKNSLKSYKYPYVCFESQVSSGTYIRSLVEDIGKILGTGSYMSNLKRSAIGKYKLTDAIELVDLNYAKISKHLFTLDK